MEQTNNRQNVALLVMDVQNSVIRNYQDTASLLPNVTKAIQTARKSKMSVIYITVGFRQGFPEVSPDNKSFSALKGGNMNLDSEDAYAVHSAITPQAGDIVMTKRRVSAFTGSDLEVVLRSQGIKQIVLCGIATSGVVLSTLREAADKDYLITVLSDCCADRDDEVHRVLMTKVFVRQAEVFTVDEWSAK